MRLSGLIVLLAVSAPFVVGSVRSANAANESERIEIERIRMHFDSVLVELDARDISVLSSAQRTNRERLMTTLAAYRDRGVFPHNYDFADPTPYFVDRKTGTLCAVAHLLESTGRRDIVDRVARMNNNVWVADLAGDAQLERWLDDNGLTLAEAARIQVPYIEPAPPPPAPAPVVRNSALDVVGPAALGAAAVTGLWNAFSNSDGHRRGVSWGGAVSGIAAATAGALLMTESNRRQGSAAVGAAGVAIGGLSLLSSTRAIHRRHEIVSAEREAERKRVAEAKVSPIVGTSSVGAAFSLKF